MKKRLISMTLASILGVTTLVGCGTTNASTGSSSNKTEIIFWHSMGGEGGKAIDSLVKEFNDSQDEIEVIAEYQGEYDDSVNKLKSSALGNSGPDVIQVYDIGTKWMIDSGYALPMEDLIEEDGYDTSSLEANILDYYTVDDTLYSMPFNTSTPILYYNKDAFSEVGLDPETAPTNFDEILDYSSKLVKTNGSTAERYGYAMQIYGWFFEQFLVKQGVNYANEGNGREGDVTKVTFDTKGGLEIFEGWKELIESGTVGNFGRSSDNTTDAFVSGKTAMMIGSTASLADIKSKVNGNFEIGTAYLPSVSAENQSGVSIGGASLWIMDKGNDERASEAFEFIKFMVSKESQATWSISTGYFPVNTESYELEKMVNHLAENPEFNTAIEQLRESNNSSGAVLGVFTEARAAIEENLEKVLNSEIPAKEGIDNAAKTINSALEKYNKQNS